MYRNTTNQLSLTAGGTQSRCCWHRQYRRSSRPRPAAIVTLCETTPGTLYHFTSSADVKENITNVSSVDSGAWIDALQPVTLSRSGFKTASNQKKTVCSARRAGRLIADDVLASTTSSSLRSTSTERSRVSAGRVSLLPPSQRSSPCVLGWP